MYAPLELSPSLSILEASSALASAEDRESSRGSLQARLSSAGGTDRVDWQPTLFWSATLACSNQSHGRRQDQCHGSRRRLSQRSQPAARETDVVRIHRERPVKRRVGIRCESAARMG